MDTKTTKKFHEAPSSPKVHRPPPSSSSKKSPAQLSSMLAISTLLKKVFLNYFLLKIAPSFLLNFKKLIKFLHWNCKLF